MNANLSSRFLRAGLTAGAILLLSAAGAAGADKQTDAFPVFDSYIKVSGQAASVSGEGSSFARRYQTPENGALGIEGLYYTQDLGNDRSVVVEGKALAGAEDYLGKLTFAKEGIGSFEIGYKSFRTFYDGIGSFFPLNQQWFELSDRELHVDRGQFWVTATIALPDKPVVEVSYKQNTRDGRKDSTVQGRSDFTGLPNYNPPISPARGIIPGYIDLDEQNDELKASVKGEYGKLSYEAELFKETSDDMNTRFTTNYQGEVRPYPNPSTSTLLPAAQVNNQQILTTSTGYDTESWGFLVSGSMELTDKIKVLAAYSFLNVEADFTGNRPLYTSSNTAIGVVQVYSNNYENLVGSATSNVYTARVGTEIKLTPELSFNAKVRWEDKATKSAMSYTNVSASASATTGAVTTTKTATYGSSRFQDKSYTPEAELRYTGIKDVVLYVNASKKSGDGDDRYIAPTSAVPAAGSSYVIMDTEDTRSKVAVGGSWRATAMFTFRGEVFQKDSTLHDLGYDIALGDNFQLDRKFQGFKGTAIAKLAPTVTSTTRYTYQTGESQVTGYLPTFPAYDALDYKAHNIGETLDWNPNEQCFVQCNVNFVYNNFNTIYPRAGIAPAAGANAAWSADNVLRDAQNDYVYGSLIVGTVLTKADDLTIQFNYYKASNYNPELAPWTQPYGASAKDTSVVVGLKHKFTDRMIGDIKLGYYDSENPTTGGNTNFDGPAGYVSLTYAL